MSDERWRCFVAAGIGDTLRADVRAGVDAWRQRDDFADLRWNDEDTWHLTLAFLGATDPARVPRLLEVVRDRAAEHRPMRVVTGGLGGFPTDARARVAWLGVSDPDGTLAALVHDLRGALGLDADGPFRGHVTLARARHAPVDLRRWAATAAGVVPATTIEIDRLLLVRSHLGGGPARHEVIGSATLGVPSRV